MIDGDPDERWRECRVIDVSSAGAGLELLGTTPEETDGRQIILALHLRAQVRNAGPTRGPILRVGTQFVDLTPMERDYLSSLADTGAVW
jgi:PilZ domain-containing protein